MISRWNRISIAAGTFFLVSLCAASDPPPRKSSQIRTVSIGRCSPSAGRAYLLIKQSSWVRNPIDAFILQKLEEKGIKPGPPADKMTLIRRVTFDLTGLPPTPEEVEAFIADKSADAYEKVVDRLLASPHYGERWARHWLDAARYAESDGFRADEYRPNVWRYRDYVIESLNQDKPYNRFVQEQIAGDEMWPDDPQGSRRDGVQPALSGRMECARPHAAPPGDPAGHHGRGGLGISGIDLRLCQVPRP